MERDREFGEEEYKGNTMTWWLLTYGLKAAHCNVACDTGNENVLRRRWKTKYDVASSVILAQSCC